MQVLGSLTAVADTERCQLWLKSTWTHRHDLWLTQADTAAYRTERNRLRLSLSILSPRMCVTVRLRGGGVICL